MSRPLWIAAYAAFMLIGAAPVAFGVYWLITAHTQHTIRWWEAYAFAAIVVWLLKPEDARQR
jgi:uncharacterized membrane protein YgaE (UPF0421/DUF939 family)